ncbi:MAG TPA: MFS transporter [Kofleriaceae bacterium]|nr:MFS transporter [Kofleriaceae bacterium]
MSNRRSVGRTLAIVVVLELLVGAWIWFGNMPSTASAQPATAESQGATPAATVASPELPSSLKPAPKPPAKLECPKKKSSPPKPLTDDLLPIGILIAVIALVIWRLPRVELGHSDAFRHRRLLNWLPLGLTYSFLYFARYNIKQFQGIGLTEVEYGTVFGVGSAVYGLSFLLNGPLTDRWGGRTTILIAAAGAGGANALMGFMAMTGTTFGLAPVTAFALVFAVNMYFQSFGAVSIVKVNAAWFHLRERGTFGGIFGILISLGLYFAYDVGKRIVQHFDVEWLFFIPAIILFVFFLLSYLFVRDTPSDAGHPDFDLGDATNEGERLTVGQVFIKLMTHPVIVVISVIELCSGFLRQAILQWGVDFGNGVGLGKSFVFQNWGMVSCIAGITGGMFAGAISDHLFQSRRSPVSAVLYAIMLSGAIAIVPLFAAPEAIGWVVATMSMAIIGVHGMLTATASADFAGKRNTGMAVGIIDGFVYIGSTIQSFLYGTMLPASKIRDANDCLVPNPEAAKIDNWSIWPYGMIPIALLGFLLTLKIWNARPSKGGRPGH